MRTSYRKSLKKAAGPKSRALDDMRRFHRGLDIAEMWQEFFVCVDHAGRPKYRTSKQLAKAYSKNEKQLEFLTWLLGAPNEHDPLNKEFYFCEPLDYDTKRKTGGWFTEETIRAHSKQIRGELNALTALRLAGDGITINSLSRMEKLAAQLDQDFSGRFFMDGLSWKENMMRARMYVSLHEKLLQMIGYAQDIYAKSHGINFQDMSGFERLLTAQALVAATSRTVTESRAGKVLEKLVEMGLEKAAQHRFPLPVDVEAEIVKSSPKKRDVM